MGSVQKTVHYCCVSRGGRIVYAYNGGNHEIESVAALCLERTPPYHRWYLQTMDKKTFGFLMEEGNVYFAIADEGLTNSGVLLFLEHLRDEFKKLAKKGSSRNMLNLNSICLQDQLVPVIRHLISSLENVCRTGGDEWPEQTPQYSSSELSPSPNKFGNGEIEGVSSTKAPWLPKPSQKEMKKMKDHVIGIRDIEMEEHRKSTERGALDANNQSSSVSPITLQKVGSSRCRSNSQNLRKKWCRLVSIVLLVDVVVCLVLFGIWLAICGGLNCFR